MKLENFFKSKKDITIGYIGGSITEQDGYRPVLTSFFHKAYPDNEITEINVAMGGTNSFLGVSRTERDLISKNPDITVIEFSVNDHSSEYNTFFGRTYEGIIRKLKKSNPDMLIIGVGLTTKTMNDDFYEKGELPPAVSFHKEVCEYYKVPFINAGEMLYNHIKENSETMLKYTNDNVHTNKTGAEFYGQVIWESLQNYDFELYFSEKPLYENNLENAVLHFAEPCNGWEKGQWTRNRKEDYIYSCTPGSEITVEFFGSVFGIYCTTEKTSGNVLYSIDGGEWVERPTWDKYALDFDRLHYYTLEENLKKGKHTAKIKVSENKEEQSEGYYLRIIAFLVEKP